MVIPAFIDIGGTSKQQLLTSLGQHGVHLNEAARALFAHEGFSTSKERQRASLIEVTVAALGFPKGASFGVIVQKAQDAGLSVCPMELGPHFRLQFLDQPEGASGQPETKHRAPAGAITVASHAVSEDDDVPKGFYLRRIDGALWLRGYRADADHLWSPGDRLVFCRLAAA